MPTKAPKKEKLTAVQKFEAISSWKADRVSEAQWSAVIAAWNAMKGFERRMFADRCREEKAHRYVTTPIDSLMCLRCLRYSPVDAS